MAMGFVKEKIRRISLFHENLARGTADEHQFIVLLVKTRKDLRYIL